MTNGAKELRKTILKMAYYGKDANLQSVFSSVEIIKSIYDVMNFNTKNWNHAERDRFVLSKGQSTMGLLAVLEEKGFLKKEELWTACSFEGRISMQADRTKLPFLENSAGSLGHGLPMAVGMALANKIRKIKGNVYVLAGDGEMNEGTMWEALLLAGSERLDNLTLIIDDNNSINQMINMQNMREKVETFGFEVMEVNGHDEVALKEALLAKHEGKPLAIIAKTVRGYGSTTIMNDNSWFHRAPKEEELELLMKEVDLYE